MDSAAKQAADETAKMIVSEWDSLIDLEERIRNALLAQNDRRQAWQPIETVPFSTWVLLLWEGGLIPHYEIVMGSVVINQEFRREQFWDGYNYSPMDKIVKWMPLPDVPSVLQREVS